MISSFKINHYTEGRKNHQHHKSEMFIPLCPLIQSIFSICFGIQISFFLTVIRLCTEYAFPLRQAQNAETCDLLPYPPSQLNRSSCLECTGQIRACDNDNREREDIVKKDPPAHHLIFSFKAIERARHVVSKPCAVDRSELSCTRQPNEGSRA